MDRLTPQPYAEVFHALGVADLADARGAVHAMSLRRCLVAEALGTGFLLIAVVGSGILGERLAAGNTAIALLANALATWAALFALIEWLAPLSGAHFNPLVTLAMAIRGDVTGRAAMASSASGLRMPCSASRCSPCRLMREVVHPSC